MNSTRQIGGLTIENCRDRVSFFWQRGYNVGQGRSYGGPAVEIYHGSLFDRVGFCQFDESYQFDII